MRRPCPRHAIAAGVDLACMAFRAVEPEVTMTDHSPIVDQLGRLATLLREYGRDEVWLQVTQLHPLSSQHAQVVVAVEDNDGAILHESTGRARRHTFRLDPSLPTVDVGHRFHVARDESGVRVEDVPISH